MGIQGLLPLLKSIHEHRKISEFSGQTLAVDAYVWLHRGAYGCAPDLVKGIPTTRYVDYAMHRVRLLKHHNITPYIVFDGGPLPAKKGTESSRLKSRQENREKGIALAQQGRHSEARDCFVKAVDVTPEMAYQLIKALQSEGVAYVVAPYEADAQMAFLERSGIVDGIITEDSDLLVFGCKRVLFKLDSDGNCVCIRRENFAKVTELPLHSWGDKQFREMAMLSGCDYLPSIQGLGLKTSHKLLRKHKTVEGVLHAIRMNNTLKIPQGYLKDFRTAELAFLHQRVFDPDAKRLVNMTPVPEGLVDWNDTYVGEDLDPGLAKGIADGSVHPFTLQPMPDINPNFRPLQRAVLSFTRSKIPRSPHQVAAVSKPKNTITNYFSSGPAARKIASESALASRFAADEAKENQAFTVSTTSSGRRTLTAEHDSAKQLLIERELAKAPRPNVRSRFFNASKTNDATPPPRSPSPEIEVIDLSAEEEDMVTQELGYRSPGATYSEIIDVSSPPSSREPSPEPDSDHTQDVFEVEDDDIPSPQLVRQLRIYSQPEVDAPLPAPSFPTPVTQVQVRETACLYGLERPVRDTSNDETHQKPSNETKISMLTYTPESRMVDTPVTPSRHRAPNDEAVDDEQVESDYQLTPSARSPSRRGPIATASTNASFVKTPTHAREYKGKAPLAADAQWGPDLQDLFSPARSDVSSIIEVASPEGPSRRARKVSSEHDEDIFFTPEKKRPSTSFDAGLEVDDSEYTVTKKDTARKESVEAQWREKWSYPSQTKRKTELLSPRTEPQPKRLSQRSQETERAISPSPPEREGSSQLKARPRRSLPALPALASARKPLPRRNAMTFPAPAENNKAKNVEASPRAFVDLSAYRHKPLRLR